MIIFSLILTGPRYQSLVLDALYSLLSSSPPKGKKLLVICTSKQRMVLEELRLLSMFTAVLRVPYIATIQDIRLVLEETQAPFTSEEVSKVLSLNYC